MIAIYSNEHLAIAMWNATARDFDGEPIPWEAASDHDKRACRDRAEAVVADCVRQAQSLLARGSA